MALVLQVALALPRVTLLLEQLLPTLKYLVLDLRAFLGLEQEIVPTALL